MRAALAMVTQLDELRGPDTGIVPLPLRLGWSHANAYDLTRSRNQAEATHTVKPRVLAARTSGTHQHHWLASETGRASAS